MSISEIQFAGHSAILLKSGTKTIAIDPWLEGNPRCPDELKNPELDIIILTHGHADHAGDVKRLLKQTNAKLVATYELAMLFSREFPDSIVPMNKGGSVAIDELTISLTHAMHSNSFDTEDGAVYAGEACGVVVQDGSKTFYHAGDTALFSDMTLIKETYRPDIAFLPIGDRFTMGPKEAAQAAMLIGAQKVIPIHFGTFDLLTGTSDEFVVALGDTAKPIVLQAGESYEV